MVPPATHIGRSEEETVVRDGGTIMIPSSLNPSASPATQRDWMSSKEDPAAAEHKLQEVIHRNLNLMEEETDESDDGPEVTVLTK